MYSYIYIYIYIYMYTSCLYFNYVKPLLVSESLMSPKFENKTSKVDNSSTTITFNQVKLAYTVTTSNT